LAASSAVKSSEKSVTPQDCRYGGGVTGAQTGAHTSEGPVQTSPWHVAATSPADGTKPGLHAETHSEPYGAPAEQLPETKTPLVTVRAGHALLAKTCTSHSSSAALTVLGISSVT
jgi:hypothetical protein